MNTQEFAARCVAEYIAENPDDVEVRRFRRALDRLATATSPKGVWIVSSWDMAFNQVTPFDDELTARRYADERASWLSVKFVEFGSELTYP